jgi:predicted kinase
VEGHLRAVAHQLAALHASASTTALATETAGVDALTRRWEANASEIDALASVSDTVEDNRAVLTAARRYLDGRGRLFEARIHGGWARDGHGDLLAEDIFCCDDGPRILDCLEFDVRLRVGDVLADAAFLAMDLERLGRPDLGWSFLRLHAEFLGDRWPASLAHHHIAYRAQVRAKVALARARQGVRGEDEAAARLLGIAGRQLRAGRARLVLVGGPPGTGKSTIAELIGAELHAIVLRSDEVRKEVAGLPADAHAPAPPNAGIYSRRMTDATYETLINRGRELLELGEMVILDATWAEQHGRDAAARMADAAGADLLMLSCVAPLEVTIERVQRRRREGIDPSDADAVVAAARSSEFDPWPDAIRVDTSGSLTESLDNARRAMWAAR